LESDSFRRNTNRERTADSGFTRTTKRAATDAARILISGIQVNVGSIDDPKCLVTIIILYYSYVLFIFDKLSEQCRISREKKI
jgi:hypothetical protein